jgi:excisionase family DNA binding protein
MAYSLQIENISLTELTNVVRSIIREELDKTSIQTNDKNNIVDKTEFLTRDEIAVYLRVSKSTIDRYAKNGKISRKRVGTRVLYSKNDINKQLFKK